MKQRTGLGRKVSSIFDGVPVPGADQNRYNPAVLEMEQPRVPNAPRNETNAYNRSDAKPAGEMNRPPVYSKMAEVARRNFENEAKVNAKRKKIATLLACVLAVIFVFTLYNAFKPPVPVKSTVASQPDTLQQIPKPQAPQAIQTEWKAPEPLPVTLRDPMQVITVDSPVVKTLVRQPDPVLVVKGIVFSADKPAAIINSRIVYQGQSVEGVTVAKINKDNVEFVAVNKKWSQAVEH